MNSLNATDHFYFVKAVLLKTFAHDVFKNTK